MSLGYIPHFGFGDRRFTLSQASYISRVPHGVLRNWLARDLIDVGQRHEPTGRWLFHVLDLIQLATMHDVVVRLGLPIPIGTAAAGYAALGASNAATRGDIAALLSEASGRPNINLLVARGDHGRIVLSPTDIRRPGANLPPRYEDDPESPLRRAHIVVPVYALLADCLRRVAEAETGKPASVNPPTYADVASKEPAL